MFKKIINTGFTKIASILLAFITGLIISRVYGAEGKGKITLLLLIPTIISIYASFSIGEGFLYFIGKDKISKQNFSKLLLKASLIFIPVLLILYITAYFFIDKYTYYFSPQILLVILLFLNSIYKFSLRGILDIKNFNFIQILEPLVVLIFLLLIAFNNLEIKYLLWGYVLSNIIAVIYMFYILKNKLKNNNKAITFKEIFNYGYKVHFFRILNFTEAKFDILLVGYLLNVSQVGIYSIAVTITLIFQSVVQTSISTVLLPTLVKSNYEEQKFITLRYFKLSLSLAFLFLMGSLIFGKFFIVSVYGEEFRGAYIPMIILLLGALIKAPAATINSFFKSIGKPEELYKTSIITVIINILLCFILIPKYGITGAAISSSISYFLYGTIMLYKFKKITNFAFRDFLIKPMEIKKMFNLGKKQIIKYYKK